ncbi:MAG: hypothetical protein R6X25_08205 [Candidatus Krumholzibacteriia bacterium]
MLPCLRFPDRSLRLGASSAAGLLLVFVLLATARPAAALLHIDFEQKYLTHPGRQTWDFCLVRPDSVFHVFYHTIHETTPFAARGDTIWHAVSSDLRHWPRKTPVLTVGPGDEDAGAIWAPEVFWDPDRELWAMLYTGVDVNMNQRTCLAFSPDLETWSKFEGNPVFEPDSTIYKWSPSGTWSDFRDPFVFTENDRWVMLNTAALRIDSYAVGIIHRASSDDLVHWLDEGAFFTNDGSTPHRVLESTQYNVRDGVRHLYFGEYGVGGISHIAAEDSAAWTMADRSIIDLGNAPEVKQFDGVDIFARICAYQGVDAVSYAVRFDTLTYHDSGRTPKPYQPHPLKRWFAGWTGMVALGQPTFGDNPAVRGDEPVGLVGNGYFGSAEYFQGPLSGTGQPGLKLADEATGTATSHPFFVMGHTISLLVGGGDYPKTCFVGLYDARADTLLLSASGDGTSAMRPVRWNVTPFRGRLCVIKIVDEESGVLGHINVDEIHESYLAVSDAPADLAPVPLVDHGPSPNPFNPATDLRFTLTQDGGYRVRIHDLRGRVIWSSGPRTATAGPQRLRWSGVDSAGRSAGSGVYLYSILVDDQLAASGKLTLLE